MLRRFRQRIGFPQLWNQFLWSRWPTASSCYTAAHSGPAVFFLHFFPPPIRCLFLRICSIKRLGSALATRVTLTDLPLLTDGESSPKALFIRTASIRTREMHLVLRKKKNLINRACTRWISKCQTSHFKGSLQFLWVDSESSRWEDLLLRVSGRLQTVSLSAIYVQPPPCGNAFSAAGSSFGF